MSVCIVWTIPIFSQILIVLITPNIYMFTLMFCLNAKFIKMVTKDELMETIVMPDSKKLFGNVSDDSQQL